MSGPGYFAARYAGAAAGSTASLRQMSVSMRFSASSSTANASVTRSVCSGTSRSTSSRPCGGQPDRRRAAVVRQPEALDHAARLERRDDLGRVGLRRAQPGAQRAQLQLAAGGRQHHQHREARGRQALALEVGASRRRTLASASSRTPARRAPGDRRAGRASSRGIMPPAVGRLRTIRRTPRAEALQADRRRRRRARSARRRCARRAASGSPRGRPAACPAATSTVAAPVSGIAPR